MKSVAKADPTQMPMDFHVPVITVVQPDGSLVVRPGKPEVSEPELSITEFSKQSRISTRHLARLCELGRVKHRRLTDKRRSKIMIPRSELARYGMIEGDV